MQVPKSETLLKVFLTLVIITCCGALTYIMVAPTKAEMPSHDLVSP